MSPYSRCGRINVLKMSSKVILGKYLRSLKIIPKPLRAILNLEFVWLVKDNCLSKIIPRCLCLFTNLTGILLNIKEG